MPAAAPAARARAGGARSGRPSSETSPSASASASNSSSSVAALLGLGPHGAVERRGQLGRQVGAVARQRREHGADPARRRARRAGAHRVRARERLVEDQAERVEVGARVHGPARGLLGRHVGERAHDVARQRQRVLAGEVGDAEVGQLRRRAARGRAVGHDHVLRLDVAVDDAALVGVVERVGEREADAQHVAVRQLAGRLELGERAALHQLGDEVAAAVLLARVEQRDDRVVVEPRDGAGLALRALGRGPAGRDDLDRHGAAEALVAGGVDRAEAAGAEARAEPVAPHGERRARRPAAGRRRRAALPWRSRGASFHAREAGPSGCTEGFTAAAPKGSRRAGSYPVSRSTDRVRRARP